MSGFKDPWDYLFMKAVQDRKVTDNDLIPFWVFETEGGYMIERHVPILPFSRDMAKIAELKRGLVLYRMVFGQPRQEDLISFLQDSVEGDELENLLHYRIDLEPRIT
jgi:hypothetical protein